jgi:hypothetical protein
VSDEEKESVDGNGGSRGMRQAMRRKGEGSRDGWGNGLTMDRAEAVPRIAPSSIGRCSDLEVQKPERCDWLLVLKAYF